jgi:dTDP-4-dehydrorhamnose reductase
MAATRVLVLGATGMLGSMVADLLSRERQLAVTATARDPQGVPPGRVTAWCAFNGADDLDVVREHDWIVNCIGVIKPFIDDADPGRVENAIRVNALLPHQIAAATAASGARIIQIATDCVYSGVKGGYTESDFHDALDVYGKTKSLGEVPISHVSHLRASIIGPEAGSSRSLLEWFLGQPRGASLNGFVNHRWNGLTTLHFAKICRGLITGQAGAVERQHLIPSGDVTKFELLQHFAAAFERPDVDISPTEAASVVDRTLATEHPEVNHALWGAAGYDTIPTVPEMIGELAGYDYRPTADRARSTAASSG